MYFTPKVNYHYIVISKCLTFDTRYDYILQVSFTLNHVLYIFNRHMQKLLKHLDFWEILFLKQIFS